MRKRRIELGLTQLGVAEAIGVTFQQIQKYERGSNRIVASRLYDLANTLDVPLEYFFEEAQEASQAGEPEVRIQAIRTLAKLGDATVVPLLLAAAVQSDERLADAARSTLAVFPFDEIDTAVLDLLTSDDVATQRMAIDAIKAGVSAEKVDNIARKHIHENGFKGKFGHGLGHGVGMAVHEPPGLNPLRDTILEPGMVCTVEPGIYLPGWGGIRLENMVVVRENHAEVLNTTGCEDFVKWR